MIKLVRVDYRLLHGQTGTVWCPSLDCDCILIANDSVVNDSIRKTAIKLCKPAGVKLVLKNIDDSIAALKSGVADKYKLFIIVESPQDANRLALGYSKIDRVSLGHVSAKDGSKQISNQVYLNDEERKSVKEMISRNIRVELQTIPTSGITLVDKLI